MCTQTKRLVILFSVLSVASIGCSSLQRSWSETERVVLDGNCDPANESASQKLLYEAERLLDHGKAIRAEKKLLEAITLNPDLGAAHNNLGLIYFSRRQLYEAAHAFNRAIVLMPTSGLPHNNLAMVLEEGGRFEEAIVHYEQAYAAEPLVPEFIGNLARARLRHGASCEDVEYLLRELVFLDTRADWIAWANDELALGGCLPCRTLPSTAPPESATPEATNADEDLMELLPPGSEQSAEAP